MAGNWKRPEYIELSAEEIEWHMRRGRQLRSQAAHDMFKALATYVRRTLKSVSSARYAPEGTHAPERRVHV